MSSDKIMHFLAGACIMAGIYPVGILPATLVVVAAAIGREFWNDTRFDVADILATLAGGAAMLAWLSVLTLFF